MANVNHQLVRSTASILPLGTAAALETLLALNCFSQFFC